MALDMKRIESRRNGFIPCVIHDETWKPSNFSQRQFGKSAMGKLAQLLRFKLVKFVILTMTAVFLSFGIWGSAMVEVEFDHLKLIPDTSYSRLFQLRHKDHFPSSGYDIPIYSDGFEYSLDYFERLDELVDSVENAVERHPDLLSCKLLLNFHGKSS